ncbi:C2 domain-containing protein 2-like isoform X2 [Antedon mediterranea]|uniref:C2 domain-containing protein 2-like isoform X2 n=1 Tax=Antedon mediterranea TaxID=105859 RepID=UPI003AF426A7
MSYLFSPNMTEQLRIFADRVAVRAVYIANNMAEYAGDLAEDIQTGSVDVIDIFVLGFVCFCFLIITFVSLADFKRRKRKDNVDFEDEKDQAVTRTLTGNQASPRPGGLAAGGLGLDEPCQWINSLVSWFYMHQTQTPEVVTNWMKALNEQAKKHGGTVQVTFDRLKAGSLPPKFSCVQTESGPRDQMTISCIVEAKDIALVAFATQNTPATMKLTTCEVNIKELTGKIQFRVQCASEQVVVTGSFDGKPNIILNVRPQNVSKGETVDMTVVEDVIKGSLIGACTTLTIPTIALANDSMLCTSSASVHLTSGFIPVNDISSMFTNGAPSKPPRSMGRRLMVKVIKANGLRDRDGATGSDPYCVVEVDCPLQKHKTTVIKGSSNPFWDEHFLFDLNEDSLYLKFEVYDRDHADDFLGGAEVHLENLKRNPSTRQIILLQGRGGPDDTVKGSITVEFLFMEYAEPLESVSASIKPAASPSKKISTQRTIASDGTVITTVTTTTAKPRTSLKGNQNDIPTKVVTTSNVGEGELAGSLADTPEAAIRHLSDHESAGGAQPKKSTLIIEGVARMPTEEALTLPPPSPVDSLGSRDGFKRDASPNRSKRRFNIFKRSTKEEKRRHSTASDSISQQEPLSPESMTLTKKERSNTLDLPPKDKKKSPSRKKRILSFLKKDRKKKYSSQGDLDSSDQSVSLAPSELEVSDTPSRSASTGNIRKADELPNLGQKSTGSKGSRSSDIHKPVSAAV